MIPALFALAAQAAPAIIGLFDSDDESTVNKAARAVSTVAQAVTGTNDDDAAAAALKENPEHMLEFQRQVTQRAVALFAEETKRLETVNQTIRAEVASSDPFVRRWRPFFGYVVAITWGAMMLAIAFVIVTEPNDAATVITAMASLGTIWGVALSVLGVSVWQRSKDKQGPKTADGFGALSALAGKLRS